MDYMEELEKDMTTEVVDKPDTRKEALLLMERLKAIDFGQDWQYTIFWKKHSADMSAVNINEEFENITNPVQKFTFSENYEKVLKSLDKSAGFKIWNQAIDNFNLLEDPLSKYKMVIIHEVGHSFARFNNGYMVNKQEEFNYLVETLFKMALVDNGASSKKRKECNSIAYRFKYQEAFADNYTLSRIPFIFHKRFDKLKKRKGYDIGKITRHIIDMYGDKLINKDSPVNNFRPLICKEFPNYDNRLYFTSRNFKDILVINDYESLIDKMTSNKNYQKYRDSNFSYLNALVDEDDYKLALFIMAVVLNQVYYKIIFMENMKMLQVIVDLKEIDKISAKNKKIHPSWMYVYGDNFAMAEFPKVWQSLINAKLI